MADKLLIVVKPDGSMELRGEEGDAVERKYPWLLKDAQVEKRGHKPGEHHGEQVKIGG